MSALYIFGTIFSCVLFIDWMGIRAHNKSSAGKPTSSASGRDSRTLPSERNQLHVATPPATGAFKRGSSVGTAEPACSELISDAYDALGAEFDDVVFYWRKDAA